MVLNVLTLAISPILFATIQRALAESKKHTVNLVSCETDSDVKTILFENEWHMLISGHPSEAQIRFLNEFKRSEVFSHVPVATIQDYETLDTAVYTPDLVIPPQCEEEVMKVLLGGILTLSEKFSQLVSEHTQKKETIIDNYILLDLLSGYLSETTLKVARDQAFNQDLQVHTTRQRISALFLDVCSFTDYSTSHSVKRTVEYLNDIYSLIIPIIKKYRGDIDKFIGDGCLAVFTEARDAVQAALHIFDRLKYKAPPSLAGTALHAGIHTGNVIRCRVGGNNRFDYTLIGKVVNIAAKLQTFGRKHSIMVSKETLEAAGIQIDERKFKKRSIGNAYKKVQYTNIFRDYEASIGKFQPVSIEIPTTELGDVFELSSNSHG